jgi:MFS family permease
MIVYYEFDMADSGPGVHSNKRNLTSMALGNTLLVSINSIWIMFLPFLFLDWIENEFLVGLVFTLAALFRAVTILLGGRAADRIGRKKVIILGHFILASGPLILRVAVSNYSVHSYIPAIIAILGYSLARAGGGLANPATSMLLVESSPKEKKGLSYMLISRVVPSIPPALLIFIGVFLYESDQFGLALIIGTVGLLGVAGLYSLTLRETLPKNTEQKGLIDRRVGGLGLVFWLMICAFALDSLSSSGLSWYVPVFLETTNRTLTTSVLLYGVMISSSTLIIAFGALLSGWLVDRVGVRTAIVCGWTLLALTVAFFPHFESPLEITIIYSIWAGLDMVDLSVPPLVIEENYPEESRASMLGVFSSLTILTGVLGPALISFSLLLGVNIPFYVKAILNLCGAFLFWISVKSHKKEDAD